MFLLVFLLCEFMFLSVQIRIDEICAKNLFRFGYCEDLI